MVLVLVPGLVVGGVVGRSGGIWIPVEFGLACLGWRMRGHRVLGREGEDGGGAF